MCGITGVFGRNNPKENAIKSLEKITHRGDNNFETRSFTNGTIGANRLAIVDIQNGKQPASNENKTIFAVQNGEIYNFKKIKKELEVKGHEFTTDSDTEALVHMYEEYGKGMINLIDSEMFAFIVFDKENGDTFIARDPIGVKPLYCAEDNDGQKYFASELKQLSGNDSIKEIKTFPAGHYSINGVMKKYFSPESSEELKNEKEVLEKLEKSVVEAVRKRVDTELPIGVFLSGGVDSSLIMEIANRNHPDVTAIILGYPESNDYKFAKRLCEERGYKYHIVNPEEDYESKIEDIIYHAETYEPNVIRHSFALDTCSREARKMGLKVVLVGEGADELFCGYNEFSGLNKDQISKGCLELVKDLGKSQLQRVDRMSMKHTIEVRVPLLDKEVIDLAMRIDSDLKIKKDGDRIITKYILRKLAEKFLPEYIAWRQKEPFANGAGMNVGVDFKNQDGDVAMVAMEKNVNLSEEIIKKYKIKTKEEEYCLSQFIKHGFFKLVGCEERIFVKERLELL